ncbi:MAG: hypothetical protein ACKO9Q_29785, partial [Pirellula sp.]
MRSRLHSIVLFAIAIAVFNNSAFVSSTLAQDTPARTVSGPATTPNNATQDNSQHLALMQLVESLEPYHAKGEIKGTAVIAGSTTMQSLARAWSERFQKFHPDVTFTK